MLIKNQGKGSNAVKEQKFNQGWYFWKEGHEADKKQINLPHDAMLEEERVPDLENGNATGFYPGGKYIYVKPMYGEKAYEGKSVIVEFEGIYMNSTVLMNGEVIGGWIYGYTNFYVDLTEHLRIGEENELKVIVDNSMTPNSRWYSGSGIYRDVHLYVGDREHIVPEGIRVTTLSTDPAVIRVETETTADAGAEIICEVFRNGDKIAEGRTADTQITIPKAELWDAENPNLYTLIVRLMKQNAVIDEAEMCFGIRSLAWDAGKGFQVNGKTVKLKGGCIHHDNGPLGACSVYKAEYRRVKKLKELGYNAIRYSHNPAGRLFLEICDEVGMYVVDESFDQWKLPQTAYDYSRYFDSEWEKDVRALVKKDYSHPSVIMYCVGNEITDTGLPHGALICKKIAGTIKSLDASRPTMIANNVLLSVMAKKMAEQKAAAVSDGDKNASEAASVKDNAAKEKTVGSQDANNVLTLLPRIMASITAEKQEVLLKDVFSHVDIVGYNYGELWYEKTHEMVPERVRVSSETFPCKIGSSWKRVENSSYLIGDFMWTAWDYLGEAGVGLPVYGTTQAPFSKDYPCLTAGCGSVDLTGYVESQGYYTSIVFGAYKKPYIAVRPVDHAGEVYTVGKWRLTDAVNSWSWPEQDGKIADIEVYSIGAEIELFQDGISLGRKPLEEYRAFYQAEYRPGKLEAVSYDAAGNEVGREALISAGKSEKMTVLPEEGFLKADGEDLAYINILITDEREIVKMLKDRKISVTVEGAGFLRALASGNPETTENFSDSSYTSYHGRLLAIVQSNGEKGIIRVTASAEGVETQTVELIAY